MARFVGMTALLAVGSCSPERSESHTYTFVLAQVGLIVEAEADGTVNGLDLDGRVDDMPAPESCNKIDFTAPNGTPGIDNQMSLFGPILGLFGGDPEALIQGAINEGSLLLLVQFEGLDDLQNDDDVTVRILFGEGPTDVGNNGLLVPGQSFDIKPNTDSVVLHHMRLVDGYMEGSTTDVLVLPVRILDQSFDLPVFSGRFAGTLDAETGEITGLIGGGVPTRVLIDDLILQIPGGQDVAPIATLALGRMADLAPNDIGGCEQVSAAMTLRGVTAFVLPPAETTD